MKVSTAHLAAPESSLRQEKLPERSSGSESSFRLAKKRYSKSKLPPLEPDPLSGVKRSHKGSSIIFGQGKPPKLSSGQPTYLPNSHTWFGGFFGFPSLFQWGDGAYQSIIRCFFKKKHCPRWAPPHFNLGQQNNGNMRIKVPNRILHKKTSHTNSSSAQITFCPFEASSTISRDIPTKAISPPPHRPQNQMHMAIHTTQNLFYSTNFDFQPRLYDCNLGTNVCKTLPVCSVFHYIKLGPMSRYPRRFNCSSRKLANTKSPSLECIYVFNCCATKNDVSNRKKDTQIRW